MRRLQLSALVFVAWAALVLSASAVDNATITGDGVRLREEPRTGAGVIGTLNKGERVEIVYRTGESQTVDGNFGYWFYVSAGDTIGYVFGHFIAIDPAAAPSFEPLNAPGGPKLPYEDWGACPFECCVYREWRAEKKTVVRADRYDTAPALYTVRAGEWATALTGVVITTLPGRAEVRMATKVGDRLAVPGDVVELFTYQGEGFYMAWFKGQLVDGVNAYDDIVLMAQPSSVWWVKMQNKKGEIGWTDQPENFGHKDACGGE